MLLPNIILMLLTSVKILGNNVDLSSLQHLLKPIFVKVPPKNLYVTPLEPAVVECVVKQATVLRINCLDDPDTILKTSTASLLDHSNDSFYFQKNKKNDKEQMDKISKSVHGNVHSVNLTLREKTVESWFVRQFWCQCEATFQQDPSNSADFIISKKSYIEISYIEKLFKQEPNSASLYLGRYVKLTCIAPDGNPKPMIYWKKDGKKLKIIDTSKIQVSDDGSLVIFSTSPLDNGIYECVAYNQAGIRVSNEAKLEVLEYEENGDWLPWTPWNACPSHCSYGKYCIDKCLKYLRRRSRLCKSTGKDRIKCPGPSLQTESCANFCRVDGEWGPWSEWSLCQLDCTKEKLRRCNDPSPQSGGRICLPKNNYILRENCSFDLCPHMEAPLSQIRFIFRDMVVYVVLSVALFLLIIIATVVICLQKKHFLFSTRSQIMSGKINTDKGRFILLKSISEKGTLNRDTNSESIGTFNSSSCNNSSPIIKENSLKHDSSNSTIFGNQQQDSVTNVDIPPRNVLNSKQVSFLHKPISCHYKETELPNPSILTKYPPLHYPSLTTPVFLPTLEEDDSNYKSILLTNSGGKVVLGSTGIAVTIMPDTFIANEMVYIDLFTKYGDEKLLEFENYTQLSSIIFCTFSKEIQIKKPIIFTFPHCISWKSMSNWEIKVVKINSDLEWEVVTTLDYLQQTNKNIYCHIDSNLCYIMTFEIFSFCLIGNTMELHSSKASSLETKSNNTNTIDVQILNFHLPIIISDKRLCVVSFLEPLLNPVQLQLSCYIFIDTKDTLEYLIQKVTAAGCKLFDIPKTFYFKETNENAFISVECTSPGWKIHTKHKYQEIPYNDLWPIRTEPFVTKNINIEHVDTNHQTFNAVVTLYQNNFYKDKVDICVSFNSTEITNSINKNPAQIIPGHTSCKFIPSSKIFRLPRATIRELSLHLDPPKLSTSQWLMMAKQLGITNNLEYFLNQSSPTTYLLMLWESQNREETALVDLKSTLKVVGLLDITNVFK